MNTKKQRKSGQQENPHKRIVDAAKKGRGLRLSAHEVWLLANDDAIARAAAGGDDQ